MTRTSTTNLLRRGLAYEIGMYRSLFRWAIRRPSIPDQGATGFGYSLLVGPVIWIFIFVSAVEVVAVHLLLPWDSVRVVFLILGIWGLIWMFGLLAGLKVHPHVVSDAGLRLRYSTNVDILIPWDEITQLENRSHDLERSKTVQIEPHETGAVLSVGVMKQTNVELVLRRPRSVPLPQGTSEPVTKLRFYADDAKTLVRTVRDLRAA